MTRLSSGLLALLALGWIGCPSRPGPGDGGGGSGGGGEALSCKQCLTASDCSPGGACAQYSGDSFCARPCGSATDCQASEQCVFATDFGGAQVQVCLPSSGSCTPDGGCGSCAAGSACDFTSGTCQPTSDAGSAGADGGRCGTLVPPATPSCCHSCTAGTGTCGANRCYGGWWCDTANASACTCKAPPTVCGSGYDGGIVDAGPFDAGPPGDGGYVSASGGTVDRLFFAVVGDTRPPNPDDSPHYPTAIITKIYADLAAMDPQPQFVITTGDYQFSSPYGGEAAVQLGYYTTARQQYAGNVFSAIGNHECSGATASNCLGTGSGQNNYQAFMASLVTPLGKTTPYYSVPVQTSLGSLKIIVAACNAWDVTQYAWLRGELAQSTTFKFVVRHEPLGVAAPCTSEMDALLRTAPYNLLLVGHTHAFYQQGRQLVVGMGGAPISGSTPFGYLTIEQLAAGGWRVIQYDSTLTPSMPVQSFTIP